MKRTIVFATLVLSFVDVLGRNCPAQDDSVAPPTRNPHYQKREFTPKEGDKLHYWLMTPATQEPGKKYPLVLTLHGRGGNTEAAGVLASDDLRKKHPCFVMAPAVTRQAVWAVPADFGGRLPGKQVMPVVLECLAQLKTELPVDTDRIYVTGQSMGGFGSFGAIATSPQTFAAAIPICGGWNPVDAAKMKDVPIWVFHGDADPTVPIEQSRKMVEAIKQAGGTPKFTEFPDVGHNSWSKAYSSPETWEWMFAQRKTK